MYYAVIFAVVFFTQSSSGIGAYGDGGFNGFLGPAGRYPGSFLENDRNGNEKEEQEPAVASIDNENEVVPYRSAKELNVEIKATKLARKLVRTATKNLDKALVYEIRYLKALGKGKSVKKIQKLKQSFEEQDAKADQTLKNAGLARILLDEEEEKKAVKNSAVNEKGER
jgi:hypothetical protein